MKPKEMFHIFSIAFECRYKGFRLESCHLKKRAHTKDIAHAQNITRKEKKKNINKAPKTCRLLFFF